MATQEEEHKKSYCNFKIDYLVDETLREGVERSPFAIDENSRYELLKKMVDAGLREFVLGISPEIPTILKKCEEAKFNGELPKDCKFIYIALLNSWGTTYDYVKTLPMEFVEDCTISFGMIELKSEQQLFETVVNSFRDIGVKSFKASILINFKSGVEGQNYEKISEQVARCIQNGIRTIRINDSVGTLFPESTSVLCERLVSDFPGVNFCLHAHDDRGLALANAFASVYAGFNMIEGSLAGLGNRAGLPSMELIDKLAKEKSITFGNAVIDSAKVVKAAQLADEIFMNIPNVYRPVSGLFVNRVNFGVLNIPDYLNAEGDRDYVMNIAALHPNTIKDALKAIKFEESKIQDENFISAMTHIIADTLQRAYTTQMPEYLTLIEQMKRLYGGAWLGLDEIRDIAFSISGTDEQSYI